MVVQYYPEVRFVDIDVMGHVNNAVYFNYFEQARMKFFEEMIQQEWDWNSAGIVLARNEIDYKRPITLNEKARIDVTCEKIGNTSLVFAYNVGVEKDGEFIICSSGKSVIVCFDYKKQQVIAVPQVWKERIKVVS